MIDADALRKFVEEQLDGSNCFPVEVKVTPANEITVEIDSTGSVDIDRCIALTRAIEEAFDRDVEDYELEVGSSGLTSPLRDRRQYLKNLGNRVEVLASDGKKYRGELREAGEDAFTVECREKVRHEGQKRPVEETVERTFRYDDIKYTKYILEF